METETFRPIHKKKIKKKKDNMEIMFVAVHLLAPNPVNFWTDVKEVLSEEAFWADSPQSHQIK